MAFELKHFEDPDLHSEYLEHLLDNLAPQNQAFYGKLWNYYRNPLLPSTTISATALNENSRPYMLAQEAGLPPRITGVQRIAGERLTDLRRKEVVIENDIGWRIQTMVDYLFGKNISIRSKAKDRKKAAAIETLLNSMLEANGGIMLLQELALLGSVYGFVDIAMRIPADWSVDCIDCISESVEESKCDTQEKSEGQLGIKIDQEKFAKLLKLIKQIRLEAVDSARIIPVLDENDYRSTKYWIQHFVKNPPKLNRIRQSWIERLKNKNKQVILPESVEVVEIIGKKWWQRYENRKLVAQGPNALGKLPIVHIQNVASGGTYEGLSDVEALIPMQDELNTRLSDRANRVTYQSFKMYLGKGIEDFLERPVGPGQMWATHNLDASIEEFGKDDGSPSEDIHIEQTRQALDKISGVTPLAAGLIRGQIGNLSSATALRVTLSGLLAKNARKRLTYGNGIAQLAKTTLAWLDKAGIFSTKEDEREIEIHWPSPLPTDESELLKNAQIKKSLGVSQERILTELGYERNVAES